MKNHARLFFHSTLQDFIEPLNRGQFYDCQFDDNPAVKDLIESQGVPHTEVAAILSNGESVEFNYQMKDGDQLEVYPISLLPVPRPRYLLSKPVDNEPRFVLDVHLGTLARYLRLTGFDVIYKKKDPGDEWIASTSAEQGRIVVTRDKGLLKRAIIEHGYWLRSQHPKQQMKELVQRYHLVKWFQPFKRCTHCNGLVRDVIKSDIQARLPEHVREHISEFRQCSQCHHIYWKGSHYTKIEKLIRELSSS